MSNRMGSADLDFEDFMERVNRLMLELVGCDTRDIADYAYYDCWIEGWGVLDTVKDALAEAGFSEEEALW